MYGTLSYTFWKVFHFFRNMVTLPERIFLTHQWNDHINLVVLFRFELFDHAISKSSWETSFCEFVGNDGFFTFQVRCNSLGSNN